MWNRFEFMLWPLLVFPHPDNNHPHSLCSDNLRTSGFYSSGQFIIFPVHLKILVLLGLTTLFQAIMISLFKIILANDEADDDTKKNTQLYTFAIFQSVSIGASHVVIGAKNTLACFLLHPLHSFSIISYFLTSVFLHYRLCLYSLWSLFGQELFLDDSRRMATWDHKIMIIANSSPCLP